MYCQARFAFCLMMLYYFIHCVDLDLFCCCLEQVRRERPSFLVFLVCFFFFRSYINGMFLKPFNPFVQNRFFFFAYRGFRCFVLMKRDAFCVFLYLWLCIMAMIDCLLQVGYGFGSCALPVHQQDRYYSLLQTCHWGLVFYVKGGHCLHRQAYGFGSCALWKRDCWPRLMYQCVVCVTQT